jgi:hypothetical protein
MSGMSDILAAGLASLASIKGDVLTYCATYGGTYAALTGFVIHVDRVQPIRDGQGHIEEQEETATAKGPATPLLVVGYFVKDTANADRIWLVEGVKVDQQQIARLRRFTQGTATPNRGTRG